MTTLSIITVILFLISAVLQFISYKNTKHKSDLGLGIANLSIAIAFFIASLNR